jgi:lathosterol oxidase
MAPATGLSNRAVAAKLVNWGMIALVAIFALQNPVLKPFVDGSRSVAAAGTEAVGYARNVTAALQNKEERAALLGRAYEYATGDGLGDGSGPDAAVRRAFYEINEWKTSLLVPASWRSALSHVAAIWVRNYIAIHFVYFGFGGVWAFFIYSVFADKFFPRDPATGKRTGMPTSAALREQMVASMKAFPFYVMMPLASEWLAERGLTRGVHTIAEMGGFASYLAWTAVYLFFVEWAIYWIHRLLHEWRWAYLWLHHDHHIYNNMGDMSPFAGLAFHPLDGMLQASPYVVGLVLFPVHFWTHLVLLFFTGIWTAVIHDTLKINTEPIMGSKYHMYHHTGESCRKARAGVECCGGIVDFGASFVAAHFAPSLSSSPLHHHPCAAYRDNYGQFFVFFDWLHETLTDPLLRDPSDFGRVVKGASEAADAGTLFAASDKAAAKGKEDDASSSPKSGIRKRVTGASERK